MASSNNTVRGKVIRTLLLFMAGLATAAPAAAQTIQLFDGKNVATIFYDNASGTPIRKSAELLQHDLTALSGQTAAVSSKFSDGRGVGVIIGRADSPGMAALLKKNKVDVSPISGKWEVYGRAVVPAPWNAKQKALVIFGSDTRGTIWGVIDLSREIGVSAWEWWADVKIRRVDSISASAATYYSKQPSVKYRGFFINTLSLQKWAANTFDPEHGGIGLKTYARVFELMWRLKANMLWPAMTNYDKVFNEIPGSYDLASDYAIVRGSSHVEMLLRNNGHEWDPKTMGPYNWLTNKARMLQYWREAVEKFGKYDNLYTVGLRGADDFPMEGAATPEQMADVVSEVIAEQRKILSEVLHKPADQVPQVFTPYKEITTAYNTGRLKLPADIILNWSEDNFGYIMQLDNPAERKRPGGSGVYYHATFWGAPAAYLWLGSTDPTLMWEEMTKAYHFNARNLWVLNVGSIKPVEYLNEFFLAMAFDIEAFEKPESVQKYLHEWAGRNFGPEHQDEVANVMWRYYKLAFDKNPELASFSTTFPESSVQQSKFNILDFSDENARRADAYRAIIAESAKLMEEMPADRKSAFYELVQYTVNTGGNLSLRQLALDKSIVYGLQHRASANVYAQEAKAAQERIAADTRRFNEVIENGKWNGMVTDYPHALPNYEAPYIPQWQAPTDARKCGVQVEGGGYFDDVGWWTPTLPSFHRELGAKSYYLDVFTEASIDEDWSAQPSAPWIKIDRSAGRFSQADRRFEERIMVSIDWATAPEKGEGTVTVQCSAGKQPLPVHVRIARPIDTKAASFIDSQGVVAMYANHADERSGRWKVLEGVGHAGAALQSDLDLTPVDVADAAAFANAPRVVYRFATGPQDRDYSFPNYVIDEIATIKAIALPTFPITKSDKLRIAISLDGGAPKVLDFSIVYYGAKWRQNVLDNAAVVALHDVPIAPGNHTLTVTALDPGITLDRFEIVFAGASGAYMPIPETRIKK
ncbi:MAG TPA: glycosyl hydrolase 115 family protein [Terriglobales bacterium]|nr:glycosyl hydrolase 115 family protein [Terriglobales bacterium]